MQPIHQRPLIPTTHLVHSGNVLETGAMHPIDIASIEEISDIIYLLILYTETSRNPIALDTAISAINDIQRHLDVDETAIPDSSNIRRMIKSLNFLFPNSGNLFFNTLVFFAKSSVVRTYFPQQENKDKIETLLEMLQQGKFNGCITRNFGNHFALALIKSIYEQKLGSDTSVLKQITISVRHLNWSDAISQQYLAASINHGKFGKDPDVLKELAISIRYLNWSDAISQQYLAASIKEETFGTNTDVLKELATSIGNIKWTDCLSQLSITVAIYNQKFGSDTEVLKQLIISIPAIEWTNPIAQQHLISSIREQKFGTNPDVVKELASSIGSIQWTDTDAQQHLAKSIFEQKFGTDDHILEELASSVGLIKWTEILSQRLIAAAILDQKFGANQKSLKELAESIGSIQWTDVIAQCYIMGAILNQRLGTDRDILVLLALSSLKIQWDSYYFNQIKVFILTIVSTHFNEYNELISAMDHIRQFHFNTIDIAKFIDEQNHVAELNSKYVHKLREPSTIQSLRFFFETDEDIFKGYTQALDTFKARFSELGLVNDKANPEEQVEERFFLYKNPTNKKFYFLSITGSLTDALEILDPANPDFDVIFKQEFLNGISNETISLYSLNGASIELFQVENKDHLIYFPFFMHDILNRYHNKNSLSPKIRLQSWIQEKMISSFAANLISEAEKLELRSIAALAFSDPKISSASGNTYLKRNYDHALTMKFFGNPDDSTHLDQAFQETLTEILDFCQSCFDKETDIQNYVDILLFSAFMFGHLSSAYVFGWHTGGANAENNSNQIFREISLKLFKKLNEEINEHQTHFLTEEFLTPANIEVLERIVIDIQDINPGIDTEGIGICIGQIMANISSNPGLYGHIERFFL